MKIQAWRLKKGDIIRVAAGRMTVSTVERLNADRLEVKGVVLLTATGTPCNISKSCAVNHELELISYGSPEFVKEYHPRQTGIKDWILETQEQADLCDVAYIIALESERPGLDPTDLRHAVMELIGKIS